ncbi:DUF1636 domain-containing protein [Paroceanicella profunda]|uniref:DUF1636 domain-containing protein n=1 Tax=Paroceanicella profunda TaxID=2579971 RepID=A0A5B8FHC1_9RHOB|nr:DUF1636 domain-containing protein [Paroceanicella profunda]QDL92017.1 DUF1636 domain-containing protein [Paroceanicella profunda]
MQTVITICDTCRFSEAEKLSPDGETGGALLAAMIERGADGETVAVRRHSCLMGCERHCNVALSAPGKLTYVLGRFLPEAEAAEAIVDFARQHALSESGQVPFRAWPQGVKGHFVARIPPLPAP